MKPKDVNIWVKEFGWFLINSVGSVLSAPAIVRAGLLKKMPWWPDYFQITEGKALVNPDGTHTKAFKDRIYTTVLQRENLKEIVGAERHQSFIEASTLDRIPLEYIQKTLGRLELLDEVRTPTVVRLKGPKFITRSRAARLLAISVSSVAKLASNGAFPEYRPTPFKVLYDEASILAYRDRSIK